MISSKRISKLNDYYLDFNFSFYFFGYGYFAYKNSDYKEIFLRNLNSKSYLAV